MSNKTKYSLINDIRLCVSGHLLLLTTVGQIRGFTTLQPKIIDHFQCSTQESSYILTFWCMGSAIAGFLPSFVLPVTGLKNSVFISAFLNIIAFGLAAMSLECDNIMLTSFVLFLSGIPSGIGCTAVFNSSKDRATPKNIGLVMTIQFAGISTAAFLLPLLYEWTFERFGSLKHVFLMISVFMSVNILGGFLLLETDENDSDFRGNKGDLDDGLKGNFQKESENQAFFSFQMLKEPKYLLFTMFQAGYGIGWSMMVPYLQSFLEFLKFETSVAVWLVAYVGIIEAFGRVIFAVITDRVNKINLMTFTVSGSAVASALGLLCYYYPETFPPKGLGLVIIYISFTLNGFLDAGYGGLVNAVLVDITDDKNYKVAQGMMQFFMAFWCVVGPYIGGLIVDYVTTFNGLDVKQYYVTFIYGCVMMLCGAFSSHKLASVAGSDAEPVCSKNMLQSGSEVVITARRHRISRSRYPTSFSGK